jgi:lambda repressor-like predicted transcriptional regulator
MKKFMLSFGGAALVALMIAATAMAAGPMGGQGRQQGQGPGGADGAAGTMIPAMLGLTPAEVQALRQDGLSLAQIADREDVDPQALVDALRARWTARIEARVEAGALTADEATALKAQVELRARDMVYKTTIGGMRGAAVGAGGGPQGGSGQQDGSGNRGNGNRGNGAGIRGGGGAGGAGNGACDGSGRAG